MIPNPVEKAFYGYGDFYETRSIARTRKSKWCRICGSTINTGSSNIDYKFYCDGGDYPTVAICMPCSHKYKEELRRFEYEGIPAEVIEILEEEL